MSDDHFADLQSKVHHTDARVTAIEREVGSLGDQLTRIEHYLIDKPPVNYAAWVGVILTVILMFSGSLFAISEYVDLQLTPIRDELVAHERDVDKLREFQSQAHYEFGVIHEWKRSKSDYSDKQE